MSGRLATGCWPLARCGQLATGSWLLAREEVWKTFLREQPVLRLPLNGSVLANRWRTARLDLTLLASRQQPAATSQREVLA